MQINDRMIIAAALDRIFYDDPDRFAAEDARTVRRLIPHARSAWLRLAYRVETQGPSMKGEAAGVGDLRMEGDKKVAEGSVGGSEIWRCGQYKITSRGSHLEIWQVMSDEYAEDPKGAQLEFYPGGEPKRLAVFQPRDIDLRIPFTKYSFVVRSSDWVTWKLPMG